MSQGGMPPDPKRELEELCADALAGLGEVTGKELSDAIAQLATEFAAVQERLRVERGRLEDLKRKSFTLYKQLARLSGVSTGELWERLSTLLEIYGTYSPSELQRLRSGLVPLLLLTPSAPIVCHGQKALYPGGGWYGTYLAEPAHFRWNGQEWAVILKGPRETTHSYFRCSVSFGSIAELGLASALRCNGVLVGTRLIRGYVGEYKAKSGSRAEIEKIRSALLYARLHTDTISDILG